MGRDNKGEIGSALKAEGSSAENSLHPAWRAFINYCAKLQHGEIELLKIQDGLPVMAEKIKKKVKFP